jgi:hypothetical protein
MTTNNINVRGLTDWEFEQLKTVLTEKLSFKVTLKRYTAAYLGGAIDVKPTKDEKYYWSKERFSEVFDVLVSLGADYNRSGAPENMLHGIFCNGFRLLKFRVDEANMPFIPGMVPVLSKKHGCFQSRSAAENYITRNKMKIDLPLLLGMHSKDGYVVYEPSCKQLRLTVWTKESTSNISKKDIWGKEDLHYRYRVQAVVTNFTPVQGVDQEGVEYSFNQVMVYRYLRASGEEYISEREYLPWSDDEIRNVVLPSYLRTTVEKLVEDRIAEEAMAV